MELYTKSWLEENEAEMEQWQREAFHHFSNMLCDEENPYPCVPGMQGFQANSLRFGFVHDPREKKAASQLATLLKEYGEISRDTGRYASLVVFFDSKKLIERKTEMDEYQQLFWSMLSRVHQYDEKPWPDNIPKDPHHHEWEFCFDSEPYFSFCATPAHVVRKSRSFPCFMLAFQPRWVFKEINDSTTFGKKLKKLIRKRLVQYDGVEAHPSLKWYGQQDNHEWKQYFLSDDDTTPSKCPFTTFKNKFKILKP